MPSPEAENGVTCQQETIARPVSNFSPSMWGDRFASFSAENKLHVTELYAKENEALKEKVKSLITAVEAELVEKLNLIDIIQRLGISYQFEKDIREQIEMIFRANSSFESDDLHTAALFFRLLRQHGYNISSCIFSKFTEDDGKFKKTLSGDAILSLYEAAQLRTREEHILDAALAFSTMQLESLAPCLSSPLKEHVVHALEQPLWRGIPRAEARHFISIYEEYELKNDSLLRLAKLDFNFLQVMHLEELREVSRWWNGLDLLSRLSYARDRVVECYFWTIGVYSEPQYSRARIMLAKTISIISVIDDTYDSYGTVKELAIFTEAVQRWDVNEIDRLPDYMKICYKALLDLYEEYEEELAQQGRSFAVTYAKETMKEIVRSYYIEAKWFLEGYMPPFDEYMKNALVTSTYYLLAVTSFMGMETVPKEAFDWLMMKPKIQVANVTICRVIDDLSTYEIEKKRGQETTGIECYMKDYNVSEEEAKVEFNRMADNAWKDINEQCLRETSVSRNILTRIINLARLIDVVYKHNQDGYTHPEKVLKPLVTALLVDHFNIES